MVTSRRINLWSSPRNISTALMYSFGNRSDTAIVDEPLYAHYLCRQPTEAIHPGREEVLSSQSTDGNEVIETMLHHDYGRALVVFKQMTHHLVELDTNFLSHTRNVLLIRNPRAILASFGKVVERVTAEDIGVPQQAALYDLLTENNNLAAVIDADLLLQNPAGVLKKLCTSLDIPYESQMLNWPAGPREEDGVWARHWYGNVRKSTGFLPYRERQYALSPPLEIIAKVCQPLYEKMLSSALK